MSRMAWRRGRVLVGALASVLLPALARAQGDSSVVRSRISGVVFDSLSSRPLAGAIVQLVTATASRQARSTESAASGAFVFDSVEAGTYLLGFYHPLLDSLGVQAPLSRVDVRERGDLRAPLAVPSAPTLRQVFCGARAVVDSVGLYLGTVRGADNGFVRTAATVRVQWSEITIGAGGIQRSVQSVEREPNDQGVAAVCGLPVGAMVMVLAASGADSSGFAELEVPATGLVRRDLLVGASRAVAVRDSSTDSTSGTTLAETVMVRRGDATLRGTVRKPDGTPLEGARLAFWGAGLDATTNSTGSFRLEQLPAGTYTVEARALGFLPQRRAIDVSERNETVADFRLESFGTYLDTVRVTAQSVWKSREMREFDERRKRGFGTFFDEEAIARRNPIYVGDLLQMTPGVRVLPSGGFGHVILMRGMGFQAYCKPSIWVDGMRVMNIDGDIDSFVNVQDIRAMEVYPRGGSVPVQFQTLEGCGSLVIWTGGRRAQFDPRQVKAAKRTKSRPER
ncbi:MAG: carboxypeptidase regulatory-like domain-containing protein [Gemmatimonadaceae bacterium]|nr:carboxypeptidase regulatory-like domain-containing protein [Gemmatimonadaceae bacterium]